MIVGSLSSTLESQSGISSLKREVDRLSSKLSKLKVVSKGVSAPCVLVGGQIAGAFLREDLMLTIPWTSSEGLLHRSPSNV